MLGELWFGFSRVIESVSPSTVLRAWTGPFGSPQDFNLPSGQSYEVKTVHSDTKSVRISSAEQLDPGARSLELAVVTVTDVDESTDNALSLPSMVERVKAMLDENNNDVDELRVRFRALRLDVTDTYYDDFWFRVDACTTYRVDVAFPAIRRTSLSLAIDNVRYEVALHGVADFKSSTWTAGSDTAAGIAPQNHTNG